MEHEYHRIDQFSWDRICEIIDAETDRDSPFYFRYGQWEMRLGPHFSYRDGKITAVKFGLQLDKCLLPFRTPNLLPAAARIFDKFLADRTKSVNGFSYGGISVSLSPQSCAGFNDYLQVYDRAIAFLAFLGGSNKCCFDEQLDHNLSEFSPQCSVGLASSKGRMSADIVPGYHGDFSTTHQRDQDHTITARFTLAPECPGFEFESSRFPFKKYDKIKLGDKMCDHAFFFEKKSDVGLLRELLLPLSSLASLRGRFRVYTNDDALFLEAKDCHVLSVVPALAAVAEMWRFLLARLNGLTIVARETGILCSIPHEFVERETISLDQFL